MEDHNYLPPIEEKKEPIVPKEAIEFNEEFPTSKKRITESQIVITSLFILLIISLGYIFTELPGQDVEVVRNESLMIGFNAGVEQGFNVGYYNGSRDYLITLNQYQTFPCLDFETMEYSQKEIGDLCEK